MAKLSKGIFWVIAETTDELTEENIFSIAKNCDRDGVPIDRDGFSSKDGLTYLINRENDFIGKSF